VVAEEKRAMASGAQGMEAQIAAGRVARVAVFAVWALAAGCAGERIGGVYDPTAAVHGREGASSGAMSEVSPSDIAPAASSTPSVGTGGPMAPDLSGSSTPQVISYGETRHGRLQRGDAQINGGSLVDEFVFMGTAGDTVQIEMHGGTQVDTGGHLDTYLYLLRDGRELTHDDDSGGNLDSRIVTTLPVTGAYTLRASTFGGNVREGEYTIVLQRLSGL
jgi:serine protease Do